MSLFSSSKSSAPMAATPHAPNPQASAPGPFSLDQVKEAVPSQFKTNITQQIVDTLNNISNDPIIAEDIRNNFVSYSVILKEGKFKIEDYINAVAYVSYKVMGYTNQDAYARTFPQRFATMVGKGYQQKDIASLVTAYNKGKLVNMILEQTLVPTWVLNQDLYQRAINVQADLMQSAQSELVKTQAANSLLQHLAKPKEGNFQISIGETENAGMREMRDLLQQLASNQREAIQSGKTRTIDVAAQRITHQDDE